MDTYKIIPLCLGRIWRPRSNMVYGSGDDTVTAYPLISYYIEGNGHQIIVDTGGTAPNGEKWMPYERKSDEGMEAQLKKTGVDPGDIDTVILTHLHWDHAGNNGLFANAKFYVQRLECEDLNRPGVDTAVVSKTSYIPVDGDKELYPGIRLILAPGHSAGMQCVLVSVAQGRYLLTGDLIPLYENWEADPKIPNGGMYDLEVITESIRKVEKICDQILPGHDGRVFERLVMKKTVRGNERSVVPKSPEQWKRLKIAPEYYE